MAKAFRDYRRGLADYEVFQQARSDYFALIKQAKRTCWNDFLAIAQGKEVFKAYKYTKGIKVEKTPMLEFSDSLNKTKDKAVSFDKKCNAFLKALFRDPPQYDPIDWNKYHQSPAWGWPDLEESEIKLHLHRF
ncbi:hypothetical protein ACJ73_09443 [Blastomyces percursus]|uniref:Uncharacterized protein n=1 Tax=Blastomyces percursus TaxID=1658174 RepID=A0A1J9Q9M9_9EURO|nr:hypothetical protein ACJ73_09443 [Blastomyces percursus]